jgi:GTP-binding protein
LARKVDAVRGLARAHPAAHPDLAVTSSVTGQGIAELRAEIAPLAG